MTDLRGLIERVERAAGPDREIDARLQWYIDHGVRALSWLPQDGDWKRAALDNGAPNYTGSVDAALALAEKVLEDFAYSLVNDYGGYNRAEINIAPGCKGYPVGGETFKEAADTMPLAIILATLRALDNQEVGE